MADAPPPSLLGGHDGLLSFDNSTGGEYPGPTTWNVFSPANNSTDSTHSNGITGIGLVWVLLAALLLAALLVISFWIVVRCRTRLARQASARAQGATEAAEPSNVQIDLSGSGKFQSKQIPIVVVLPDNGVTFGWKVIHRPTDCKSSGGGLSSKLSYSSLGGESSDAESCAAV